MGQIDPASLGEPALKIAGFQLWIHGRESPDSWDMYDGNWLRVTAHCGGLGASVWTNGAMLDTTNIRTLLEGCEQMSRGEASAAKLDPLEPNLQLSLASEDEVGHIILRVTITPDHFAQSHSFEFDIDQSYLPGLIAESATVLKEHPVRGC